MIADCPIITLSLGATRNFRFRPWKGLKNLSEGPAFTDLVVAHGSVVLIPYATNLRYGRDVVTMRIKVRMRANAQHSQGYADLAMI